MIKYSATFLTVVISSGVLRWIPFLRKSNAKMQDEETRPLIQKASTLKNPLYQSSDDSPQSKTDSSSHDEQTREPTWRIPSLQTCSISDLTDFLLKYVLFTSNLLFSALGLIVLCLGFWGLLNKESFAQEKLSGLGTDPMLVFIFLGLLLSVLCLTGCVGVLRENQCLLRIFSAMLLVLIATQVLVAILAYSLQDKLTELLRSAMLTTIIRYQEDLDLRFIMDEIQTGLQCCGIDTYRDWEVNQYFNCSSPSVQACGVPPSCCVDPLENGTVWNSQCGLGTQRLDEFTAQSTIFLGGCVGSMARWINQHSELIGIVAVALLGVQIFTVTITSRLLDKIQWNTKQAWHEELQS